MCSSPIQYRHNWARWLPSIWTPTAVEAFGAETSQICSIRINTYREIYELRLSSPLTCSLNSAVFQHSEGYTAQGRLLFQDLRSQESVLWRPGAVKPQPTPTYTNTPRHGTINDIYELLLGFHARCVTHTGSYLHTSWFVEAEGNGVVKAHVWCRQTSWSWGRRVGRSNASHKENPH